MSALIVLFILSSVSVGKLAVRMVTDRDLPADKADHAVARASTHSSAAAALETHARSPFMAYSASPATVKLDGDADDDFALAAIAEAGGLTSLPGFVASGGDRDFTGNGRKTRAGSSASGGSGFAAGGNIGAASGAYGGVSGSSTHSNTTATTKTSAIVHTTSTHTTSSASHSSSSSSSSSSSTSSGPTTSPATNAPADAGPAAVTATATTTATTTVSGRTGGVVALSVPGPLGGGSPAPTPEPISLLLIGSGLGGALGWRRLFH